MHAFVEPGVKVVRAVVTMRSGDRFEVRDSIRVIRPVRR
jgi:hypothetical protein